MVKYFSLSFLILIVSFSALSWSVVRPWKSSLPETSVFVVSEELSERVEFWVKIYSYYSINQGVFHLTQKPQIILGEIDLGALQSSRLLNAGEKGQAVEKYLSNQRNAIAKKYNLKATDFRLQMGLKERTEKAFFESGKYISMMEKIFVDQGLPKELTRIVFVESSFNILAQSKVGASGLWQIMPFVAKPEGYIQNDYDKRNHPYYSTLLAAEIFKQNYKSLKSWPLAVTAYNHGLGGIRKMKRKIGSSDLVKLIETEKRTKSWGFASENFYSCFLAILEVERRATDLFGADLIMAKALKTENIKLKRKTTKKDVLKVFGGSLQKLKQYNPHIRWTRFQQKSILPIGFPLIIPFGSKL